MRLGSTALGAAALLVAQACSTQRGDPPPSASSGALPAAPPNATGALAAGRASAEAPLSSVEELEDPELEDEEEMPMLPTPVQPDDGGTAL